jgi:hypothetical protein
MRWSHWRLRGRWQVNITINSRDIGHCCGRELLRVFVNTVMNLRDSINSGKFLTSLAVVELSCMIWTWKTRTSRTIPEMNWQKGTLFSGIGALVCEPDFASCAYYGFVWGKKVDQHLISNRRTHETRTDTRVL